MPIGTGAARLGGAQQGVPALPWVLPLPSPPPRALLQGAWSSPGGAISGCGQLKEMNEMNRVGWASPASPPGSRLEITHKGWFPSHLFREDVAWINVGRSCLELGFYFPFNSLLGIVKKLEDSW